MKRLDPVPAFRWTAILAALSIWILGLLAAAPHWHASLHSDASQQDHSCAVTLFSHGVEPFWKQARVQRPLNLLDPGMVEVVESPIINAIPIVNFHDPALLRLS